MKTPLELLEELLGVTASYKDDFDYDDREAWIRISAECADIREGGNEN